MNLREIRTGYDYNYWAHRRILTAAAHLSPEQYTAPTSHSYGSLRGTLVHLLDAELGWRELCQHGTTAFFDTLTEQTLPTLAQLQEHWNQEERAMRAFLDQLKDDNLDRLVRYVNDEGVTRERVLWHCLWHVLNHGTQHRSEAAAMLTDYGASPGDMDFTAFLNENPQ